MSLITRLNIIGFGSICSLRVAVVSFGILVTGAALGWRAADPVPTRTGQAAQPAMYRAVEFSESAAKKSRDWRKLRRERLAGPYIAHVLDVIDGDTFVARITIWLGQDIVTRVRLRGIDTPELKSRCGKEARLALEAKHVLTEFLAAGKVYLRDIGAGKYAGRVIAKAYVQSGSRRKAEDSGAMLLAGGYARPYRGGRRGGWCGSQRQAWN